MPSYDRGLWALQTWLE
jgi:hypothetical protein